MKKGITIKERIGIGDKVQYSSLPENYFKATGKKLVDVSKAWIFDHNPYVDRDTELEPDQALELWNFGPTIYEWPRPRENPGVYLSNAEVWASLFGVRASLIRPRLYAFENFPFEDREMILFHPYGRSHGALPDHVIEHVLKKYGKTGKLFQIGLPGDLDLGVRRIPTPTIWDLASTISQARMFIGADSGPSWIAACFPDIVVKKVKIRRVHGEKELPDWVPLEIGNFHSHWDDRLFQIYNPTEQDVGFTQSYLRL